MTPEDTKDLEAGARVAHALFGPGTVLDHGGYGGYEYVEIKFDLHGTKQLCCEMAAKSIAREWP